MPGLLKALGVLSALLSQPHAPPAMRAATAQILQGAIHHEGWYIPLTAPELPAVATAVSQICEGGTHTQMELPELGSLLLCREAVYQGPTHRMYTKVRGELMIHRGLLIQQSSGPVAVIARFQLGRAPALHKVMQTSDEDLMKILALEEACAKDMADSPLFDKFYGAAMIGGRRVHIYEFIQGETVQDREPYLVHEAVEDIRKGPDTQSAALDEIACITEQLIKARIHMFKKGWFHGDMAMHNVMLSSVETYAFTEDIKCPMIKVIDFDDANKLEATSLYDRQTEAETLLSYLSSGRPRSALSLYRGVNEAEKTKVHPKIVNMLKTFYDELRSENKLRNYPRVVTWTGEILNGGYWFADWSE